MKKGAIDQVFIYIFVMIVIAFIIFFGFKQITNLNKLSEKSNYAVFKSDFSKAIDNVYYMNKGSTLVFSRDSRNKPLALPKDIKKVCFEDNKVSLNSIQYANFTVEHLNGDLCMDVVNGALSFRLENSVESQEVKVKVSDVGT